MPLLKRGELDLMFCYRSQAEEGQVPFLTLPDEISLGAPDLADRYATASYQCDDGTIYRGAPIAYTATPLTAARRPLAAAAFLSFLALDEAAEAVRRHAFRAVLSLSRPRLRGQ